jgi:mannose-1-phosphate guanylyltransferase / phosphomannomutase
VVIDTAGGAAAVVLPTMLGRLGVDALIVNNRLDESSPTESLATHMQGLARLGELVASSRASFGARFDPVAERLALVDERGQIIHDERALLVVMDLVAAERRSGTVALPVTTTRVAEQVAAYHGVDIEWTGTSATGLSAVAAHSGVVFAGDGRGGFVVPEFSAAVDGVAAFARLLGLVARTKLTMSEIDARIPQAHVVRREVPTPWSAKGAVMRAVLEAAGDRTVDTTDGIRVVEPDGRWALVLPDPAEAVTHLWAEAESEQAATALLDTWAALVESPPV